jgi:hypothetical protein
MRIKRSFSLSWRSRWVPRGAARGRRNEAPREKAFAAAYLLEDIGSDSPLPLHHLILSMTGCRDVPQPSAAHQARQSSSVSFAGEDALHSPTGRSGVEAPQM